MIGAGLAVLGMWLFLGAASLSDAYENSHAQNTKNSWSWLLLVGVVVATLATYGVMNLSKESASTTAVVAAP